MVELEYHIPGLGRITATLYPYSSKTYELLSKYNHINRMREIDQLGVIRGVYEGAHHPRWEYVMVQLGLIHRLSTPDETRGIKPSKGWGLSKEVKFDGKKISGADIIQMWILLLNAGHLPGTFSTEKAILKCIRKDSKIRSTLKRGLPDSEIRSYLDEILETENIYGFHKILSFFFLERYRRFDSDLIDLLVKVLKFYCFEPPTYKEKRENLRHVFKRIRQVSYLYLDTRYGPTPFDFDLPTIFMNLPDHLDELLDVNSPLVESLKSFDDFLAKTVYQSADSLRAHSFHVREVTKIIEDNNGIRSKITELRKFLKEEDDKTYFEPHYMNWENAPKLRLLLKIPPFLVEYSRKILNLDLEERMNEEYGTSKCLVAIQPNPRRDLYAISLSFFPKCQETYRMKILGRFIKDVVQIQKDFVKPRLSLLIDKIFDDSYRNLVIFVLKQISQNGLIFYFQRSDYYISTLGKIGSTTAADRLKRIIKNFPENISKSRLHELATFQKSLQDIQHPSPIILSLNQINVLDNNRRHITDLDGVGLGYKRGQLYLLLAEAKSGRKGRVSSAKKRLSNTIDKLKLKTSIKPTIGSLKKYGAYCYIPIDGIIK
jgi:hypothetical protein